MGLYDELLRVTFRLSTDSEDTLCHKVDGTQQIQIIKDAIAGKNLVVALDQATRNTGACIMDFDTRKMLVVMDIANLGFPRKQDFFEAMYVFLKNHIEDETIKYFMYEIPVEHSKNVYMRAPLEAMRQFIKGFKVRMPSLSKINMIEVPNQVWKSSFLVDKKYNGRRKNREDVKESAREEAASRLPEFAEYFYAYPEPPDCCDAVGIAYGTLQEMYSATNANMRRINSTMPKTNCKYRKHIAAVTSESLVELLKTSFWQMYPDNYEMLEFNSKMSVEDNCNRYCSAMPGKLGVIPIFDSKIAQEMKWETGVELKPNEFYVVLCWR